MHCFCPNVKISTKPVRYQLMSSLSEYKLKKGFKTILFRLFPLRTFHLTFCQLVSLLNNCTTISLKNCLFLSHQLHLNGSRYPIEIYAINGFFMWVHLFGIICVVDRKKRDL